MTLAHVEDTSIGTTTTVMAIHVIDLFTGDVKGMATTLKLKRSVRTHVKVRKNLITFFWSGCLTDLQSFYHKNRGEIFKLY